MLQCCNLKYSEIRGKDVIDSEGKKVGDIIDCIFDISENMIRLKHIVLGGGMIEEFLESIKARPDIDPVCNISDVDSISDKVYLKVDKESLRNTIDPGVICETDLKFSQLSKLRIVDSDGLKIGNIIDIWFDKESQMWLVVGGGFFEELLEKLKIQPDIDLIVPTAFIKSIKSGLIELNKTKYELESTCEDEYAKVKKEIASTKSLGAPSHSFVRLGPV